MIINLFGIGAAGNKAAINAIRKGIIDDSFVKLLNTTTKDIPDEFKINTNLVVQFSSMLGGCGKEPEKGKKAIVKAIQQKQIEINKMISDDVREVVLVTSTEGGTGCGATPMIAKYFSAMDVPVHVFALIGFQDELRGINNTLKFFKELPDDVILHTIKNSYFLEGGNTSYTKAEELANDEFATQLEILIGSKMRPSNQNIDDTDHYKITSTPGYMDIKHIVLEDVKSKAQFTNAVTDAFEYSSALDYDKTAKRLAVIINANQRVQDAIDDKLTVIKNYSGEPFEIFRHIQEPDDGENYIDVILSGMNFPEADIVRLGKKYQEKSSDIKKQPKSFSDIFDEMSFEEEDDFDMDIKTTKKVNVDDLFSDVLSSPSNTTVRNENSDNKEFKVVKTKKNPIEEF